MGSRGWIRGGSSGFSPRREARQRTRRKSRMLSELQRTQRMARVKGRRVVAMQRCRGGVSGPVMPGARRGSTSARVRQGNPYRATSQRLAREKGARISRGGPRRTKSGWPPTVASRPALVPLANLGGLRVLARTPVARSRNHRKRHYRHRGVSGPSRVMWGEAGGIWRLPLHRWLLATSPSSASRAASSRNRGHPETGFASKLASTGWPVPPGSGCLQERARPRCAGVDPPRPPRLCVRSIFFAYPGALRALARTTPARHRGRPERRRAHSRARYGQ